MTSRSGDVSRVRYLACLSSIRPHSITAYKQLVSSFVIWRLCDARRKELSYIQL
jgi:hypothetical protein